MAWMASFISQLQEMYDMIVNKTEREVDILEKSHSKNKSTNSLEQGDENNAGEDKTPKDKPEEAKEKPLSEENKGFSKDEK